MVLALPASESPGLQVRNVGFQDPFQTFCLCVSGAGLWDQLFRQTGWHTPLSSPAAVPRASHARVHSVHSQLQEDSCRCLSSNADAPPPREQEHHSSHSVLQLGKSLCLTARAHAHLVAMQPGSAISTGLPQSGPAPFERWPAGTATGGCFLWPASLFIERGVPMAQGLGKRVLSHY